MELIIKHFDELAAKELNEIYQLRVSVFVVEQNCPYQEVDEKDKVSYHLWLKDEEGIEAYARALPPGVSYKEASIGRIIAKKRRQGLGTRIVNEAIKVVKEKFNADVIRIEAQIYARTLYEKAGFIQVSEPFVEDGIVHILMDKRLNYHFYGNEHTGIHPLDSQNSKIGDIRKLYDLLSTVWSKNTCAPRMSEQWSEDNRTLGQCSITSFLVQDLYGGKVYGIPLDDGNFHCYNVVDGKAFDLTSEQFDHKLEYPIENEQFREVHFAKKEKYQRYLLLREELLKKMSI